jgi:hypothetical protein
MMLATWHKGSLPKGWAYPVGVELLSQVFGLVPFAAEEPLRFTHAESYRLAERRRREAEDLPLQVLEAGYSKFHVAAAGPRRPLWFLEVGSVPSSIKSWVRQALVNQGLARVRIWLLSPFSSTALESEPRCAILVQEAQRRLYFKWRNTGFESDSVEELQGSPGGE